jgi:hypothetical protein
MRYGELHDLHYSTSINFVIKSRTRRARYVARIPQNINACWSFFWENLTLGRPRRTLANDTCMIRDIKKPGGRRKLDSSGSREGRGASSCEQDGESVVSIKCVISLCTSTHLPTRSSKYIFLQA